MRGLTLFVASVAAGGLLLVWLVGTWMLDLRLEDQSVSIWLALVAVLALFPAVLAALPPKFSLALLGAAVLAMGVSGWQVLQTPGDGGIGGIIVLMVAIPVAGFGLAVIALRSIVVAQKQIPNDF